MNCGFWGMMWSERLKEGWIRPRVTSVVSLGKRNGDIYIYDLEDSVKRLCYSVTRRTRILSLPVYIPSLYRASRGDPADHDVTPRPKFSHILPQHSSVVDRRSGFRRVVY